MVRASCFLINGKSTTNERILWEALLNATVLAPAPDHAGLLFRAEPQLFIEARSSGAEPEEFDFLEARMIENPLNDLCADALFLVRLIDDHIPDGCPIHEICQDAAEAHQLIAVPRAQREIGVAEHFSRLIQRAALGPGRLMEELEQFLWFKVFLLREGNGALEGDGHLVLEYARDRQTNNGVGVYEETHGNASP